MTRIITTSQGRVRARHHKAPIFGSAVIAIAGLFIVSGIYLGNASAEPGVKSDSANQAERTQTARRESTQNIAAKAKRRVLEVQPGDTMITMLKDAGLSTREAFQAVRALEDIYSPRNLRPGQQIRVATTQTPRETESGETVKLAELRLRASAERDVMLTRDGEGSFAVKAIARELKAEPGYAAGQIESSLMAAAHAESVPMKPLLRVIHGFSYAVDFQRDLRKGNRFEMLWTRYTEADGQVAKVGALRYAALTVRGEKLEMYRFERPNGDIGYFNGEGESVRRLLMRTPINGARLSSNYGMRKHPILGYSRMHEGIDFAAPSGTPIYAAGNGRIGYAGWNGGYGRYVRIQHQGPYKTAYAHLSRIAEGIHGGAHVSQGDVIGYLGSTGQSTGPHLHYEIHKHGKPVNPRNLELPTGYRLKGEALKRFKTVKADIDRARSAAAPKRLAQNVCAHSNETADSSEC